MQDIRMRHIALYHWAGLSFDGRHVLVHANLLPEDDPYPHQLTPDNWLLKYLFNPLYYEGIIDVYCAICVHCPVIDAFADFDITQVCPCPCHRIGIPIGDHDPNAIRYKETKDSHGHSPIPHSP